MEVRLSNLDVPVIQRLPYFTLVVVVVWQVASFPQTIRSKPEESAAGVYCSCGNLGSGTNRAGVPLACASRLTLGCGL
jgi:hypothetical protein